MHLADLKEEKKAGRVRYIGVQVIGDNFYPQLESVMHDEPIDFWRYLANSVGAVDVTEQQISRLHPASVGRRHLLLRPPDPSTINNT